MACKCNPAIVSRNLFD